MTKAEFIKKLESSPNVTVEIFNSNNAWGFGGAIGKRYKFSDVTVTIAEACFRHTGTTKFVRVDLPNNYGAFDAHQGSKNYDKAFEVIEKNLKIIQ